MRILMLVNWKIEYCKTVPCDKQPPDYYVKGKDYWFHKYFNEKLEVDVIDISSFSALENFEKNVLHFYIRQGIKAIPKLDEYDLIVSHGVPSALVVAQWRKLHKTNAKHIVFDIGCFNSAAESGFAMKLMQKASKSIDGIIYHTRCQYDYYKKYYPWLCEKSQFIRFGTDTDFFETKELKKSDDCNRYIICVGDVRRDWDTLVEAYKQLDTDLSLKIVGHVDKKYDGIAGIEQIPRVPIKEMINLIYNSRLCVLPLNSYPYSYGQMTFLQQMALGKCVVAAKVPSLEAYENDNENIAVFYESENAKSCADAIMKILNDDSYEQNIINNAKNYLNDICNEKIMAKEIELFYNKILHKDR